MNQLPEPTGDMPPPIPGGPPNPGRAARTPTSPAPDIVAGDRVVAASNADTVAAADARVSRLYALVGALDHLSAELRQAKDADEIGRCLGAALHSVGMQSAVCLLDRPMDLTDETAEQALETAVAHARYLSLAPARLRALERLLGRRASAIPLPLGRIRGLTESLRQYHPLVLDHIEHHLRDALPWLPSAAAAHTRRLLRAETAILAPLACRGRVRGFLAAWAPDLSAQDAPLVGACALQASAAFDSVWLALDAERHERRLFALSAIGTEVSNTLNVHDVFERVVARSAEALGVDHIGLWLLDTSVPFADATESPVVVARLVAQRGLSPLHQHLSASLDVASGMFGGKPLPRGVRSSKPFIYSDVSQASDVRIPPRMRLALLEQGYRSLVAAPIYTPGNDVIGTLIAYSAEPRAFRQEDGTYLEAIGRYAAVAIEQGQLFRAVESGRALLAAVFDADPAGLAVIEGSDYCVRMANPQLRALSAIPDADPLGHPIADLFPVERSGLAEDLPAILESVHTSRHPITVHNLELRDAAGETRQVVSVHVAPIDLRAPDGAIAEPDAPDDRLVLLIWDTTAHVRAEARLAAQVQRAETLATVATALERERHLPDLLRRIVRAAQDLTGADTAVFVLRQTASQRFRAVALVGADAQPQTTQGQALIPDLRVLRPLLREGHTLLCDDVAITSAPAEARLFQRAHVRALAGAAVQANEGWVMGGLVVGHRKRGHFSTEHTDLLRAFAAQAAAAIQRTRALEEARRQADELEAVFGGLAEGVAIYDASGALVRMNLAATRIVRPHTTQAGAGDQELRSPALRGVNGSALRDDETPGGRAVGGEVFTDAEYLYFDADGRETLISASGAPLLGASGTIQGGVVAFRDVTQVRQLERRTRESLDALLQLAATLVAPAPDQDTPPTHQSQRMDAGPSPDPSLDALLRHFCRLIIYVLGCEQASINLVDPMTHVILPGVVVGLTPEQAALWREEQLTEFGARTARLEDRVSLPLHAALLAGEPGVLTFTRPPYFNPSRPHGSAVLLPLLIERELVGVMMLDHHTDNPNQGTHAYTPGDLALAQGVARLAALAVRQRHLRRMATEIDALRAANQLKEEFLSIASHELKTPLTVLQARTQSTQRRLMRQGHDEAAALFAPVQASLNRILALINELLDASRIEAGKLELHREHRNMGDLVREAVHEARERSEQHFEVRGTDAPDLWVEVDPERMMQVLANLLDNAVKYSPPDGEVTVCVGRSTPKAELSAVASDEVVLTISDQGVGIPPDEVEHVFERFYRARTSSVRQYGGLGLGLHIAATIVERHGGRIWAESPGPGAGSTFGMALPPC